MTQTSSPTLLYDLGGSMNDVTSGGGREGFIFTIQPDARRFSTFSPPTQRFPERSFAQSLFHFMDRTSDQGTLLDYFLLRLCLEGVPGSLHNILYQSRNVGDTRVSGISSCKLGVDVRTLLTKQDNDTVQLSQIDVIRWIRTKTGLPQDRIARLVGVTRQTLYNWERGEPISDHNRQRLLQIKDVLERATFQHSTPEALTVWLDTPRGSEGYTPAQLLEQNETGKARLFAISSPSPRLKRAQLWVRRSVPEVFTSGGEHYDEASDAERVGDHATQASDVDNDGGSSTIL